MKVYSNPLNGENSDCIEILFLEFYCNQSRGCFSPIATLDREITIKTCSFSKPIYWKRTNRKGQIVAVPLKIIENVIRQVLS